MPRFSYTGRNNLGAAVTGELDASSASVLAKQLSANGVIPLEIEALPESTEAQAWLDKVLKRDRPSRAELTLFTRQIYSLSKAGVPLMRGLRLLAESTRNKYFATSILTIIEDLESGRDLAGSMARQPGIFSSLYISMVRVGEASGRLDEALLQMHDYLERESEAIQAIKSALRYPTFVLITLFAAFFIVVAKVIPGFSSFYGKHELTLPFATRALLAISDVVADYWLMILTMIVLTIAAFIKYINSVDGRLWWDSTILKFPKFGELISRATLARFARSFSMAMRSGVPILQALAVTSRAVGNEYVTEKIISMRDGIERGDSLSRTAARTGVFSSLVLQMISVGEETGQVDEMLSEVAEFYEREVAYDIKRIGSMIEPLLTIGVAILVLLLALGVYLPMWDIAQLAG